MEVVHSPKTKEQSIELWEGFIYLTFFIFFNLFVLPNMPKSVRIHNYDIEMIVYGFAGIVIGIFVFKMVKNSAEWVRIAIVSILYALIIYRLVTNWQLFTIPGN